MYNLYYVYLEKDRFILEHQITKTLSNFSFSPLIKPTRSPEEGSVNLSHFNYVARDKKHIFICEIKDLNTYEKEVEEKASEWLI